MINVLVIYYSLEGNCEYIAKSIKEELDCDIIKLMPKKEIDKTKFSKYLLGGKQVILGEKPNLLNMPKNLEKYDLIFIGTLVWAGSYAPAIKSFFQNAKIFDKYVAFFCCHQGGKGKTLENLEKSFNKNHCIGKIDFFSPLKKEKERSHLIAKSWANEIFSKVKLSQKNTKI